MTCLTPRARWLLLLSASFACRSEKVQPDPTVSASATSSTGAMPRSSVELLPLVEPPPPQLSPSCGRTLCTPEQAQAPSPHYPAPFERCSPLFEPNDPLQEASFSPRLTAERRAAAPGTSLCCYQLWASCPGKNGGRPLLLDGTSVQAPLRTTSSDWS